MIQVEEHQGRNLLEVSVSQKLEDQDYEGLIPALEAAIDEHHKVRMLWVMKDFKGWKPDALLADVKMDLRHAKDFEKVALVGEKALAESNDPTNETFYRG